MDGQELIFKAVFSTAACAAFAVQYNIRPKNITAAAAGALLIEVICESLIFLGAGDIFAVFTAAAVGALFSEILARALKTPANMYLIVSIIPLVPGGMLYKTMSAFIANDLETGVNLAVKTVGIAGSIAVGVFLVSSVFRTFALIRKNT